MDYIPKHTKSEYYDIIIKEEVSRIEKEEEGDKFQTFAVVSQHVKGSCPEECLDKIIEACKSREKRLKYYSTLPTLQELVDSNIKIDSEKMYYSKEITDPEDSCHGLSGDIILEMRKVGIKEYREKNLNNQFKNLIR